MLRISLQMQFLNIFTEGGITNQGKPKIFISISRCGHGAKNEDE